MLNDWTAEEAEYQFQATELKRKSENSNWKSHERRSKSFGTNQVANKRIGSCKVCGADHAIWSCDVFKSRSIHIQKKWGTAKKLGFCYRCCGDDHLRGECPRRRMCNIEGCRDRHNRLLHGNQNKPRETGSPTKQK